MEIRTNHNRREIFRYVTEDHETYVICGTYLT